MKNIIKMHLDIADMKTTLKMNLFIASYCLATVADGTC